jgi:YNFM family putative membrane transporter
VTAATLAADDTPDLIDTAIDRGHPYDRRLLAVCVAGFCVFLSVYATQSLLPRLRELFNVTEARAAMTITAVTAAVAITGPWIGLLSERIGRKQTIVSAILLLTVPLFGASTAHTLTGLVAWRFAQGLVMPGIIAVTMAYVSAEWPPHHVGSAMSAYITGNVLGGVTGRMMAGYVGEHFGWPRVFLVLATINLAGGLLVMVLLPRARRPTPPPLGDSLRDLSRLFGNGRLLSTYAVGAGLLFALVATLNYIAYHLAGPPFNLGPTRIGMLFLVYLVGLVVVPIGGRFIDRRGQRFALVAAVCVSMCGLTLALSPSVTLAVIGLAICCSGIFVGQAATASQMGLFAGRAKGSAAGLYATFYYAGGAAGSFAPGWLIWSHAGTNGSHWLATVCLILAVFASAGAVAAVVWPGRATE